MSDFMDRNGIIDQIVTDLIAASAPTYPALDGLTAENIRYCKDDPLNIAIVKEPIEIWVAPGRGRSIRAASTKFDTWFTVKILVIVKGWEEVDNRKSSVSLTEDIMNYYQTTVDIGTSPRLAILSNTGEITVEYETQFVQFDEPESSTGSLYFGYIQMEVYKHTTA